MVKFLMNLPTELIFFGIGLAIIGFLAIIAGVYLDSFLILAIGAAMLIIGIVMFGFIALVWFSQVISDSIDTARF